MIEYFFASHFIWNNLQNLYQNKSRFIGIFLSISYQNSSLCIRHFLAIWFALGRKSLAHAIKIKVKFSKINFTKINYQIPSINASKSLILSPEWSESLIL